MRFRVIEGGRTEGPVTGKRTSGTGSTAIREVVVRHSGPTPADVRAEGKRRRVLCGLEAARNRAAATGRAMPADMRRLALMFDFVESKLASLVPVPEDFHSDIYWPTDATAQP